MGQKVNPIGLRLKINKQWDSRWYADRDYRSMLAEDVKIRKFLHERLKGAALSKIVIERPAKKPQIMLHSARPGVIIGRKGSEIDVLRKELSKVIGQDAQINLFEVRKPEIDAKLVADNVAQQLERRVPVHGRPLRHGLPACL